MFDLILAFSLMFPTNSTLKQCDIHIQNENYDEVEKLLRNFSTRGLREQDLHKYHFYKMLAAYKTLDDKKTLKEFDYFDTEYISNTIPRRYKEVAALIKADIETWNDNKLRSIDRKMTNVSQRLNNAKAGNETQNLQKQILKDLDDLIKQKQDEAAKAASEKDKEKKERDIARRKRNGEAIPGEFNPDKANGKNIQIPANDSQLPEDVAKGVADMKKFKELSFMWGKLNEHERQRNMVELTRNLPAKYREAIEQYYKNVNKGSKK